MDIISWYKKAGFEIDPTSTGGLKILNHPEGMRVTVVMVSNYVSLYDNKECVMAGKMHEPKKKFEAFKG